MAYTDSFDDFTLTGDRSAVVLLDGDSVYAKTVDGCADGDDDSDGICNAVDSCPDTALNDADGDGVCDDVDLCPGNRSAYAASHYCGNATMGRGVLWRYFENSPSDSLAGIVAVTDDGMVYVGTESGQVRALNVSAARRANSDPNATSDTSPTVEWSQGTGHDVSERGAVSDASVFVVSEDLNAYAFDGEWLFL